MSLALSAATLPFSEPTRVQCVDVPVPDDQRVEEGEMILLSLSPTDMTFMLEPNSVTNAVIMVMDDDGMYTCVYMYISCVCTCTKTCIYMCEYPQTFSCSHGKMAVR